VEHCKRLSVGNGQKAVVSQIVESLIPLHGLLDTLNRCCLPRCRPISHGDIEPPLLAQQGLETGELVRSENYQEICSSPYHQVGIQALTSHLESGIFRLEQASFTDLSAVETWLRPDILQTNGGIDAPYSEVWRRWGTRAVVTENIACATTTDR